MAYNEDFNTVTKTNGTVNFLMLRIWNVNAWFLTSDHCFPVTFSTNCTCSFPSKVTYSYQTIKVQLTYTVHPTSDQKKICIPESENSSLMIIKFQQLRNVHYVTPSEFLLQSNGLFHCVVCCLASLQSHCAVSFPPWHREFPFSWASNALRWWCHRTQLCRHMSKVWSRECFSYCGMQIF
jgi:hypothetical protein